MAGVAKATVGFAVGAILSAVLLLGSMSLLLLTLWWAATPEDRLQYFDWMYILVLAGFMLFFPAVLLGGLVGARLRMTRR
jgi:hypothetical protein